MKKYNKIVLITGGCGFIGSCLVRRMVNNHPDYLIINFDAMTYAGNAENLISIEKKSNYIFVKGDVRNKTDIDYVFEMYHPTHIIHMCAESHVDKSIVNPTVFVETNVLGTVNLLNAAKHYWKDDYENHKFVNMGTDEIFGQLTLDDDPFTESTPFDPRSPYSTSKCCAVMFGTTYFNTYGVPVVNMASTNAIGEYQFPEKLVPLTIEKLQTKQPIPIYGKGEQIRDWINVNDFARALDIVMHEGKNGELYCIGGDSERTNITMVKTIIHYYAELTGEDENELLDLITFIPDPRGNAHDFRYAIDFSKIKHTLGWEPSYTFEESVKETVEWYLKNPEWVEHIKNGSYYNNWIDKYYNK